MNAAEVLRRLRQFLLTLSILIFGGTLLELWFVEHTGEAIQWLAFVFAGIGLAAAVLALLRRQPSTVLITRVLMVIVIGGSFLGVYQHVSNNVAFEREIQPNATTRQLIWKGVSGANPLLAPGTLAIASLLSLAALYRYRVTGDIEN